MKQSKLRFTAAKPLPSQSKGKGRASESTSAVESATEDDGMRTPVIDDYAEVSDVATRLEELDPQDKAGRWRSHFVTVREKMGNIPPIHCEGQTKVHHILRVFDNSHEYGPCIGVSRLERWQRAEALGLNPPVEVREILLTRQGTEDPTLKYDVFFGEV